MKIIDYNNIGLLTCDSTLTTCDNAFITCDADVLPGEITLKVISREIVGQSYISLYNELTFNTLEHISNSVDNNGYLLFAIPVEGIKEGDSFELTIRKNSFTGDIIYRGKAYATTVQDLENYKLNYPNDNGVIIL